MSSDTAVALRPSGPTIRRTIFDLKVLEYFIGGSRTRRKANRRKAFQ
jgi:hypothetical protein